MPANEPPEKLGPFQFVILVLSFVLLGGIAAEWLFDVPQEVQRVIFIIDSAVCGVFLVDFLLRLRAAPHKWRFMRWGWIDLLASIPAVEALRIGRLFRIVRIVRLLSAYRSLKTFLHALIESKSSAGIASVFVVAFLVVSFGSVGILLAEAGADRANIHTAEDALWWSMVTITTVGYGDTYPVTNAGRLIATVLMVTGIGLFGTLSGVAASLFFGAGREEPEDYRQRREILERLEALQKQIESREKRDQ